MSKPIVVALFAVLVRAVTATAAGPDTKRMVLVLGDLPSGFSVTKAQYADNKRAAKEGSTPLSSFVAWGRVTGYEVEFEKGGLVTTAMSSSVSLYRTTRGAHLSILDFLRRIATPPRGTTVSPLSTGGRIGHETRFYKLTTAQAKGVVFYAVLWRDTNVAATVTIAGFGLTDPALAIQLARKQETRIHRALHA